MVVSKMVGQILFGMHRDGANATFPLLRRSILVFFATGVFAIDFIVVTAFAADCAVISYGGLDFNVDKLALI